MTQQRSLLHGVACCSLVQGGKGKRLICIAGLFLQLHAAPVGKDMWLGRLVNPCLVGLHCDVKDIS